MKHLYHPIIVVITMIISSFIPYSLTSQPQLSGLQPFTSASAGPYFDYTPLVNSPFVFGVTNGQSDSVFVASSAGGGYQTELAAGETYNFLLNNNSAQRRLECQLPLGNAVCCSNVITGQTIGSGNYGITTYLSSISGKQVPGFEATADTLNENGSNNGDLNYIFLDTIINNSNLTTGTDNSPDQLGVAITNAPLYTFSGGGNDLVSAISSGKFSIKQNIFPNIANQQQVNFPLGSAMYTLTFLSSNDPDTAYPPDNRYLIFGASQHNPSNKELAYKYHMSDPNLALSRDPVNGTQTIILFPTHLESSCQPVIFIGKDYTSGSLLALTYFIANDTLTDGTPCCCAGATTQPPCQSGEPCQVDTLFLSNDIKPPQFGGTSNTINPNNQSDPAQRPLGGSPENLTLKPGRMRLTIDNVPGFQLGYASHLDVQYWFYWPGQSADFTNPSAPVPLC